MPTRAPSRRREASPKGAAFPYIKERAKIIGKEHGIPDKDLDTWFFPIRRKTVEPIEINLSLTEEKGRLLQEKFEK